MTVVEAIRASNNEVGGRLVEWSGAEYMVRARGYIRSIADLEEIVVKTDEKGTPVRLRDVATIQLGPEIRRGIAELDGRGEVAAGVVVMRHGENAMDVIRRVKERLKAIEPTLPKGVRIVTTYDRSELIERSIQTLRHELVLEMLIVSLDHPDLPLAHPERDHPHRHDPGGRRPLLHPDEALRHQLQHHVARRHRGRDRRPRGRGGRRRRERAQEARDLGGDRPQGRLPGDPDPRDPGGRASQLLLAPGHRRLLHAGLRPRGAGGPPLPAARLHEELRHGDRGASSPSRSIRPSGFSSRG